jgi:hypothetical protein
MRFLQLGVTREVWALRMRHVLKENLNMIKDSVKAPRALGAGLGDREPIVAGVCGVDARPLHVF